MRCCHVKLIMTLARPEVERNSACNLGASLRKVAKVWGPKDHSSLTGTMGRSKLKME